MPIVLVVEEGTYTPTGYLDWSHHHFRPGGCPAFRTVRLDEETRRRLNRLVRATGKTRSAIVVYRLRRGRVLKLVP